MFVCLFDFFIVVCHSGECAVAELFDRKKKQTRLFIFFVLCRGGTEGWLAPPVDRSNQSQLTNNTMVEKSRYEDKSWYKSSQKRKD